VTATKVTPELIEKSKKTAVLDDFYRFQRRENMRKRKSTLAVLSSSETKSFRIALKQNSLTCAFASKKTKSESLKCAHRGDSVQARSLQPLLVGSNKKAVLCILAGFVFLCLSRVSVCARFVQPEEESSARSFVESVARKNCEREGKQWKTSRPSMLPFRKRLRR